MSATFPLEISMRASKIRYDNESTTLCYINLCRNELEGVFVKRYVFASVLQISRCQSPQALLQPLPVLDAMLYVYSRCRSMLHIIH